MSRHIGVSKKKKDELEIIFNPKRSMGHHCHGKKSEFASQNK
jgi:hypothetical protein